MSLPIESEFAELLQNRFESGDSEVARKTLERENLSSLQTFFDALLKADLDSFGERLADDAEMEIFCPNEFQFIKRAKGKDEIKTATLYNFSMLEDQKTDLLSVVSQGDTTILVMCEKGTFRNTNKSYEAYCMHQFTINDGLIKYFRQIISFSE